MKPIIKSILFLIGALAFMLAALHFAWPPKANGFVGMQKVYPYALSDDFTETNTGGGFGTSTDGYDDAQINTTSGTINPDHSPAILGNHDLEIDSDGVVRYQLGTNWSEGDVFFLFKSTATPASSQQFFTMSTADGTADAVSAYYRNDGTLRIFVNGAIGGAGTSSTVTVNTAYCMYIHGATNGTATLAFTPYTTNQVRPTGGTANFDTVSGGTTSANIGRIRLICPTGITNYIDHLRGLNTIPAPNNPL